MTVNLDITPDTRDAVDRLFASALAEGFQLRIRSARRTCAEQAEQYAIGRQPGDTRAVVTHAKGCQSWHVSGRAVDVDIISGPKDYARLGDIWKAMGGKWGGDFPGFADLGHFEWHPGMTIEQVCPDPDACDDAAVVTGGGSSAPASGFKRAAVAFFGGLALGLAAYFAGSRS